MGEIGRQRPLPLIASIAVLGIVLVISASVAIASASDWQQFQKDETNVGIVNEKILGRSVNWSVMTHTNTYMAAGVDVVPVVANNNVYMLDSKGYIWSFDAVTGNENGNCSYNTNASFQLSTPAYGEGKIFFGMSSGTKKGHVFAVNANDVTSKVWERMINESEQINTPITYDNGKIYFGTWDGTWCDTYSGTYYCLNATNGYEIWNHTAGANNGYYWAGACIIGDYIVFGDALGNITVLNKNTGLLIDQANIRNEDPNAASIRSSVTCNATYHNATCGRVYFTDGTVCGSPLTGRLWAYDLNTTTGKLSYAWHTTLNTFSKSTPVVYNGRIYVGTGSFQANGRLYSIYESNGTIEWYYQTSNNGGTGDPGITASPVISVDGDDLYIYFTTNCENGRLYCINESGNLCWYYEPSESTSGGEYILQGVAVYNNIAGDARVFFGNDAGKLYALWRGICGDVNSDETVNIFDVGDVWNRAGNPNYYLKCPWAADVNSDKTVNIFDVGDVWNRAGNPNYPLNCCCDG